MNAQSLVIINAPRVRPHEGLDWPARLELLRQDIARHPSVVVAYSGGVDSSVVLRVAHEVLGERAHAVIGRSDSYAAHELELALAQAHSFGAQVEIVTTGELADPVFASNPSNRCYHCKSELYRQLDAVAARVGAAAVLDGTILEDLGDHRPGRLAAAEHEVRSPLADLGFTKADVRAVAGSFGLASHDKPASPCLASRIPYGITITEAVLGQVERSEMALRALGFREFRVRHHGDVARIELAIPELPRMLQTGIRELVVTSVIATGYRYVCVDLEGFRSGSLNRVLDLSSGAQDNSGTVPSDAR